MDIAAAAQDVVDQLVAGGVRAVVDGRDLNPPAVQIRPPTLHYRFGRGAAADWEAWAVVPDTGMRTDLAALSDLLEKVQAALGHVGVQARPDTVTLADGGTVPAYVLTWSSKITDTARRTHHG
jgi:hypothetical protein